MSSQSPPPGSGAPRGSRWPVVAIVAAGAGLAGFFALSQALPPIPFGRFAYPPIYGLWDPVLDRLALVAIPAGLALVAVGWAFTANTANSTTTNTGTAGARRMPPWLGLGLLIGCGIAVAAAIAVVRGDWHHLFRGVSTAADSPYYTSDLHFVYEYGVRGFAGRHPDLVDRFHSYNSRTHPPGVHLLLYGLFRLFGAAHPLRIATVLAALSMSAAVAAWSMGRTLGGERAGRIAAVLFVAAPGPLLLTYTNLDAVFATFLAGAAALFMVATARSSTLAAAAGGAVLAVVTLMTYAGVFVALAATVAILIEARPREALRWLAAAAAAGLAVFALARLGLGIDILASYQASPEAGRTYQPYWVVGSPAAFLIYAGLPLAALGTAGLVRRVPGARRATLPLVLVAIMVIWAALPTDITKLRPGEVERTWAFLYPVLAAAAGPVVDRWIEVRGRWSYAILPALTGLGVAQAVLLQALWD
jgi:hypothetical protein